MFFKARKNLGLSPSTSTAYACSENFSMKVSYYWRLSDGLLCPLIVMVDGSNGMCTTRYRASYTANIRVNIYMMVLRGYMLNDVLWFTDKETRQIYFRTAFYCAIYLTQLLLFFTTHCLLVVCSEKNTFCSTVLWIYAFVPGFFVPSFTWDTLAII